MSVTGSNMKSWKKTTLLFVLLSHASIGSPVLPSSSSSSSIPSVSHQAKTHVVVNEIPVQTLFEKDIFGPTSENRSSRKKRFVYEALKRVKQLKKFNLKVAASSTFKELIRSAMRSLATLGVGMVLFNFIHTKINKKLDNKNRQLDQLEKKIKDQNTETQVVNEEPTAAASSIKTSTVKPDEKIPELNADKVSLQIPDAVFGPAFNIANGASQVLGTLVQNTGTRVAQLFEALKPLFKQTSKEKTRKRETLESFPEELLDYDETTQTEGIPIKNSYAALITRR